MSDSQMLASGYAQFKVTKMPDTDTSGHAQFNLIMNQIFFGNLKEKLRVVQ